MEWPSWILKAGELLVLVFLVRHFLDHLKSVNEDRKEESKATRDTLKAINDTCHAFQAKQSEETNEVLNRVVNTMNETNRTLGRACTTLDRFEHFLEGHQHGGRRKPTT